MFSNKRLKLYDNQTQRVILDTILFAKTTKQQLLKESLGQVAHPHWHRVLAARGQEAPLQHARLRGTGEDSYALRCLWASLGVQCHDVYKKLSNGSVGGGQCSNMVTVLVFLANGCNFGEKVLFILISMQFPVVLKIF